MSVSRQQDILRGAMEAVKRDRDLQEKIKSTPLEEWHQHEDIMEKVRREGFDIQAAIVKRDMRARKEADNV